MLHFLFALGFTCVIAAYSTPAQAAEIRGEIGAEDGQRVAVIIEGDFEPRAGEPFVVIVDVPGVGTASIAQGEVTGIDDGIVLAKIVSSTGKVAVGQKVKIDSPQAVRKRPAGRVIPGKIGAVVDHGITIVTTSKVDPAVGDNVEVFADVPGTGLISIGVGKVTELQSGLISARIEQVNGTLSFGQQVQIFSASAQAAATSGGELIGLKLDPVDAALAELLDLPKAAGLVVRGVEPNSPADTAGLKKRDVLLSARGEPVNDVDQFRAAIAKGTGVL